MENIIALPSFPDFMESLRRLASAIKNLMDAFREASERKRLRAKTVEFLDVTAPLIDRLPALAKFVSIRQSAATTQMQLDIDFMLRDLLSMLDILHAMVRNRKVLAHDEYKKLKFYLSSLRKTGNAIDKMLIARSGCPNGVTVEKFSIGEIALRTPIRVFIEDDDTGKYVSCLEIPQLYGFGETEAEALDMLDREILSLREDVKDSDNVADEYKYACDLIDMALGHE